MKEEIVWKDKKSLLIFSHIFFTSGLFLLVFIILFEEKLYKIVASIFLIAYVPWLVFSYSRIPSYATKKGIWLGNISQRKKAKNSRMFRRTFIEWKAIREISTKNRNLPKGMYGIAPLVSYMKVSLTNGDRLECMVYDPPGFIEALKKLKKYKLLSEKSRYK